MVVEKHMFLKGDTFQDKGTFKKYVCPKFPIFDPPPPPPPLLVPVCVTCTLCPTQRTLALVSYPPLKKSSATFMNKKYF